MKLISVIFGTRPEALKLAPIIQLLKRSDMFRCDVCITGQHKEMLNQVLNLFNITPDFNLKIMKPGQTLPDLTSRILMKTDAYLKTRKPDLILVQGDTSTVLAASLAAFYNHIPVGHVEAGLRTYDLYSPFPEEINRTLSSKIATFHFAPTIKNKDNLLKENIDPKNVFVVGNTIIDTLNYALKKGESEKPLIPGLPEELQYRNNLGKNVVLITGHRREKFGILMKIFCRKLVELAENNADLKFVYPVHLNPDVQKPVNDIIRSAKLSNIFLIKPLEYFHFITLMRMSFLIITDSGGIQEEASTLGIPVLLTRDKTERPEAEHYGSVKLVGSDCSNLISDFNQLKNDKKYYVSRKKPGNFFGKGNSSELIVNILAEKLL